MHKEDFWLYYRRDVVENVYLNAILNTVEAMLLATSLVSREKCTSASNQRCLGPWFLGLNSLEMVPVHYSSIKVILNMKELLDNVHRYKDNVHFSYDTCTGLLQRYGLSFGVSS